MQATKEATAAAKETAANIGASAMSGLEKTKAVVEEKVEKMGAHDPTQKDQATQRKEEKISQAEFNKHAAQANNAATRQAAAGGCGIHNHRSSTTGINDQDLLTGSPMTGHQAAKIPEANTEAEWPPGTTGVVLNPANTAGAGGGAPGSA